MKLKILLLFLLVLCMLTSTVSAGSKPIIKADKTYFDINTGLYVLQGHVDIEVRNRVITADLARVSISSLEVWASGNIKLVQDDITFTGDSVYVFGTENRAQIDGGVSLSRTGLMITADKADFCWKTKIGVFNGNVKVTQGDKTWTADTLSYNVDTNTIL